MDPIFTGYIARATDGAARMQRLIRHIFDLARIGSAKVVPRPIDSTGAFADAMANLGQLIEETGAEVDHGPLPTVRTEYEHLVRLFQNLVSNGIKYRRLGVVPRVRVDAVERADAWEFAIADNGAGIPDIAREAIFTVFVRLAELNDHDGAGLGLAICASSIAITGGSGSNPRSAWDRPFASPCPSPVTNRWAPSVRSDQHPEIGLEQRLPVLDAS